MDFNNLSGWVAVAIAAYTAYLTRRQLMMLKPLPASRRAAALPPWWKAPTFVAVTLVAFLVWVPWIYGLLFPATVIGSPTEYGDLADGRLYMSVDLPDEKSDRKLIAVAFHYFGKVDINDQGGLQKSKPFDHRKGRTFITIAPDQIYWDERMHGMSGTNYMLLDVPQEITEDRFSTLRQAYQLGAKLIQSASKRP